MKPVVEQLHELVKLWFIAGRLGATVTEADMGVAVKMLREVRERLKEQDELLRACRPFVTLGANTTSGHDFQEHTHRLLERIDAALETP